MSQSALAMTYHVTLLDQWGARDVSREWCKCTSTTDTIILYHSLSLQRNDDDRAVPFCDRKEMSERRGTIVEGRSPPHRISIVFTHPSISLSFGSSLSPSHTYRQVDKPTDLMYTKNHPNPQL